MGKLSWIKDCIIQVVFISFAVVFTVFIAQISLSEQYTDYYEIKLEEKTETLARNAALLLAGSNEIISSHDISLPLNLLFPNEDSASEIIRYTLFSTDGSIVTSTSESGTKLPDAALSGGYTYMESPYMRSFFPVIIEGTVRHILMVEIDDTPFLEFGEELSENLYSSLFRGCLMMAAGYVLFSILSNVFKKKKPEDEVETENLRKEDNISAKVAVQLLSMTTCAILSAPILWASTFSVGFIRIALLFLGGLLLFIAAAHLCRILLYLLAWLSKRPVSTYAIQTMQFFVFLVVFLTMYIISIQNSYSAKIEINQQIELRFASTFATLSLSGEEEVNDTLLERAVAMDFGQHNECLIIIRSGSGFAVFGDDQTDVSDAGDLFKSSWDEKASVAGIRGGYKYGISIIMDSSFETIALVAVRQSADILAEEMRSATIDFLLAMSATVFAFVFFFVEMNCMLEVINIPNYKREHGWQYAKGTRSLMFLANACRYVPLYFFVLIVRDIYQHNPISWFPGELAMVLPIAVVLLVMAVGKDIASRIIRLKARKMMMLGCLVGIIGFLSLQYAVTLPLLLGFLIFTYTGVSMVYNGLWDYTAQAVSTGYAEFADMKEHTLSGEYLGGTAGAVIGAMVYDKFGLFAAFALSAAILLVLLVLIRALLPAGNKLEKAEKLEYGFFKFFFSKSVFFLLLLLLLPFVLSEYFIEQFSPLYAASIDLSPGAASWTSLLMTMALAYIGPSIVRVLVKRLSKTVICVFANILAAIGLVLFALYPGIAAMYAASALIGVSIGVGKNILAARYSQLKENTLYAHSGYVYNLFDSLFGLLGAALFTLAFIMSSGGEYILAIAGIVVVSTLLYMMTKGKEVRS